MYQKNREKFHSEARHRAHAPSERAFCMGLGVSQYFCIMFVLKAAQLCDCYENRHAALCIQH